MGQARQQRQWALSEPRRGELAQELERKGAYEEQKTQRAKRTVGLAFMAFGMMKEIFTV